MGASASIPSSSLFKTISLTELPEAIEDAVFVQDKMIVVIDPTGKVCVQNLKKYAVMLLSYLRVIFLLGEDVFEISSWLLLPAFWVKR